MKPLSDGERDLLHEQREDGRETVLREDFDKMVRYARGCSRLLDVEPEDVRVDERERLVEIGSAWILQSGDGCYSIGTVHYDPGVRYHRDGSGTPPSWDPVDIEEGEGIDDDGHVRGHPWDPVWVVVLWHLRQRLDQRLTEIGEGEMYDEMDRSALES